MQFISAELTEHRYWGGAAGWVGGIRLGPFWFMFEWVPSAVDGFCAWMTLRYGDSRRCDIPLAARWEALAK